MSTTVYKKGGASDSPPNSKEVEVILRVKWLARLYPVRTYFVKEVMRVDLDYIDSVLLGESARNYPLVASGNSDYMLAGES